MLSLALKTIYRRGTFVLTFFLILLSVSTLVFFHKKNYLFNVEVGHLDTDISTVPSEDFSIPSAGNIGDRPLYTGSLTDFTTTSDSGCSIPSQLAVAEEAEDSSDQLFTPHPIDLENWEPHFGDITDLDHTDGYEDEQRWPDYKAAIVYLANDQRYRQLIESLFYVFHNIATYPWPIIIFHTGAFDGENVQAELKYRLYKHILEESGKYAGRSTNPQRIFKFLERLRFERLVWTLPLGLPSEADLEPIAFHWLWPGYHHMCNFFAYEIFNHPVMQDVTYYMRLDTDSLVYGPLCYDPFERMEKHNLSYAYRRTAVEEPWVMGTFWETLDTYVDRYPEIRRKMNDNDFFTPPAERRESENMDIWWNNFEVVRLDAFRRQDIQDWYRELQSMPEKIYKYRWGDAVIRTATTKMFFNVQADVEKFCAIYYWHNDVEESGRRIISLMKDTIADIVYENICIARFALSAFFKGTHYKI